jgi:hypothetical protein
MLRRNLILILTVLPLFYFWGCENNAHQGTDPDKVLPRIEWVAMHVGGDPWGISKYTPQKTYYWGSYPVSSCESTDGCVEVSESFPGKISVSKDKNFVIEVKCFDPQPNGIMRVVGNFENPRLLCNNYDYYLDNGNDNPHDDDGLSFNAGSIHERPYFFHQDGRYDAFGNDYIDYEFGYGIGSLTTGFSGFQDNGDQTTPFYDKVAGDSIWTSYLNELTNETSPYRNFKSFDEIQYKIVRSYFDSSKGKMCNWRLFFFAEDTSNFGVQGVLPDLWLEITD